MPDATWVILPYRDTPSLVLDAAADVLAQTIPTRLLLVDQGSGRAARETVDRWTESANDGPVPRVLQWHWLPPLPSLSACWNRALSFVWEVGGQEAWVINSDVRLHPGMLECLQTVRYLDDALFVSGVGVDAEQFPAHPEVYDPDGWRAAFSDGPPWDRGGPDFSCYLLTKEAHTRYPFDENLRPAYAEDCDVHRRYMLAGDGHRIHSVTVPFHHIGGGSQTLKAMSEEARASFNRQRAASLEYYKASWGGGPNEERWAVKGDPTSARDGVSTPELQAALRDAKTANV